MLFWTGVDQLNVAEGAGRLANHAGDAFVALLADAGGPLDQACRADLALEVGLTLERKSVKMKVVPLPSER